MQRTSPDRAKAAIVGLSERYDVGTVPAHKHKRAQLMFAISGSLTVETEAGIWVLPTHRALWLPGGCRHTTVMRKPTELRTLYFDEKVSWVLKRKSLGVIEVSDLLRHLILEAVRQPWTYDMQSATGRLFRVLCDQLAEVQQAPAHLPEPTSVVAKKFARVYRDTPDERRPLAVIAKQVGASLRSMERLFKTETGLSLGAWVQQFRLITALQYLADDMPVGDAAYAVGFQNPSSFIALFKSQFGTTPKTYFARGASGGGEG
jgi:AraC-like DNA-binding protein